MRRVNTKINRNIWDALVLPGNTVCFVFDLFPNGFKVGEYTTLEVQEFRMLYRSDIQQTWKADFTNSILINWSAAAISSSSSSSSKCLPCYIKQILLLAASNHLPVRLCNKTLSYRKESLHLTSLYRGLVVWIWKLAVSTTMKLNLIITLSQQFPHWKQQQR